MHTERYIKSTLSRLLRKDVDSISVMLKKHNNYQAFHFKFFIFLTVKLTNTAIKQASLATFFISF